MRSGRMAMLATLLTVAAAAASGTAAGADYQLGQGYTAGAVNVAGYANVVADAARGAPARLVLDDLSLFVNGRVSQYLNPFFEVELSEGTLWRQGRRPLADLSPRFVVERLYNDSDLGAGFTFRAGKMLTPVGEWNMIHAAPLVWNVSKPMTTYRGFNRYTSGLGLNYLPPDGHLPELQLYWQPNGELIPKPAQMVVREYVHAGGVHASWPIGLNDKIGVSLQRARVRGGDEAQTLLGLNASKTLGNLQLETEATYARLSGSNPARLREREWGAYLLGAYAVSDRLTLLARHEHFADRGAARGSANSLLGLAYRPDPALVWKLEYVHSRGAALDVKSGMFGSFSVLF